jgi:hypothetical protein
MKTTGKLVSVPFRCEAELEETIQDTARKLAWKKSQVIRECIKLGAPQLLLRMNQGRAEAMRQHFTQFAGRWDGTVSGAELLKKTRP